MLHVRQPDDLQRVLRIPNENATPIRSFTLHRQAIGHTLQQTGTELIRQDQQNDFGSTVHCTRFGDTVTRTEM